MTGRRDPAGQAPRIQRGRWLAAALMVTGAALAAMSTAGHRPHAARIETEGHLGTFLDGTWGAPHQATARPADTTDGRTEIAYRPTVANAQVRLPYCVPTGQARVTIRTYTRVHTLVDVYVGRVRQATWSIPPMRWDLQSAEVVLPTTCASGIEIGFGVRQRPRVRSHNVERPELLVDFFEVSSPDRLRLTPGWLLVVLATPLLVLAFAWTVGLGTWSGLALGVGATALMTTLFHAAPLPTLAALPRLSVAGIGAGAIAYMWARRYRERRVAAWLATATAACSILHGAWAFFPGHTPPDIYIHQQRTIDLGQVPLTYQGLLTYGSHFPTPSQDRGEATDALGTQMRIPYSPLPYVAYFGLHRAGANLTWAMTVLNAALVSLLIVAMFETAARLWNPWAGWAAATLFSIDLAAWHHVGRSHAPAVIGFVLTLGAALHLARVAMEQGQGPRIASTAGWVALAFLGYSASLPLFGLLATFWTILLLLDSRAVEADRRRRLVVALVAGAALAIFLFYGHYVPELLRGTGATAHEPDRFPGRTFLVFHNESRQSMRLWEGGLWAWLLAGMLCAWPALKAVDPRARPLLMSWLAAWTAFMALKEIALFAKLLRWAKEDQFVSPLLCLVIAAALSRIPHGRWRWGVAVATVALLAWFHALDYAFHAQTLGR